MDSNINKIRFSKPVKSIAYNILSLICLSNIDVRLLNDPNKDCMLSAFKMMDDESLLNKY